MTESIPVFIYEETFQLKREEATYTVYTGACPIDHTHSRDFRGEKFLVMQMDHAVMKYLGDSGLVMLEKFMFQPVTSLSIAQVQASLIILERQREAYDEGQLWKIVAEHLGIPTRFTLVPTEPNTFWLQGKM